MINPKALETFGKYDKKSLTAGIVIGQGLKGRTRAPHRVAQIPTEESEEPTEESEEIELPAGFPQDLWDDAVQRANSMIESMQGTNAGQHTETPEEETPNDWQFEKDAFCFGIAVGRSLEGWEIDGIGELKVPDGWTLIMYYVHIDSPDTVYVSLWNGTSTFADWGDASSIEIFERPINGGDELHPHFYQSGDYIIILISQGGIFPYARRYGYEDEREYFSVYDNRSSIFSDLDEKYNYRALRSAYFEGNVEFQGSDFAYCTALTDVTIRENVRVIGQFAFLNCTSLTSVAIPDSVTNIACGAFKNCTALSSVTIPDSVTELGSKIWSFSGYYVYGHVFENCTSLTEITIPESVSIITESTFENCAALANIIIPDSITAIGGKAFCKCTALKNITIPNSVIGFHCRNARKDYSIYHSSPPFYGAERIFADCTSLENVRIGNGISYIPGECFYGCIALKSIVIPDNITNILDDAFSHCTSLSDVTIPESVTKIGAGCFSYCSSLTNIELPDSIQAIGYSFYQGYHSGAAFGYTGLISIIIPQNPELTIIGDFPGCTALKSVKLYNNIKTLGTSAFRGTALSHITIPASVTNIEMYAFRDCNYLTDVYYSGTESQWKAIRILGYNAPLTNATIHYNSMGPD